MISEPLRTALQKTVEELTEHPDHWTQGYLALTKQGEPTGAFDPAACQWCLLGLVTKHLAAEIKHLAAEIGEAYYAQKPIEVELSDLVTQLRGDEIESYMDQLDTDESDLIPPALWNDYVAQSPSDVITLCQEILNER